MSLIFGNDWLPCQILRWTSNVDCFEESGAFQALYDALPTGLLGAPGAQERTIIGDLGLGVYKAVWRAQDIDPAKGWPDAEDLLVLPDGRRFSISKIEDRTLGPAMPSLPRHKAGWLTEDAIG